MEKRTPLWVLWGLISLLAFINFFLIGAFAWQFRQNQRLRQQLGRSHTSGTTIEDAYVKLYSDQDYQGEVLTIVPLQAPAEKEGVHGDIEFFATVQPDNATSRHFNDKASSVIYLLPRGWTAVLYQDANFQNNQLRLVGTGNVEKIRDCQDTEPPFNDKATSLRWTQE